MSNIDRRSATEWRLGLWRGFAIVLALATVAALFLALMLRGDAADWLLIAAVAALALMMLAIAGVRRARAELREI